MRFLINISYDGTDFHGYQKQKGKRSVEEELEIALTRINNGKLVKQIKEYMLCLSFYMLI